MTVLLRGLRRAISWRLKSGVDKGTRRPTGRIYLCTPKLESESHLHDRDMALQKNLLSNLLQNPEVVGDGVGVGEAVVDTGVRLNQSLTRDNQRLKTQFSTTASSL
ncbi:hypothetical protein V7S43_012858 [Phytophthora oleae]|uniref:t-SNARE coiled-coil homology domain-containing protein n=1 Tax=Phytophthora oleae TaxID=2107226 RepID=A0ABD3F5R4_9STRA